MLRYGTASAIALSTPPSKQSTRSSPRDRWKRVQQLVQLGRNPKWQDVLRVLQDEIEAWKHSPQFATKLLQEVGEKRLPFAKTVLKCMRKSSIEVNVLHNNAAAGACLQCNMWQQALLLTRQLAEQYTERDVVSISTSVRASMEGSHWSLSLSSFKTMQSLDAGISRYTKAILVPLKSTNAWDIALWFHSFLVDFRLDPDPVSTAEVLSACKVGNHWQDAIKIQEDICFPPKSLNLNTFLDVLSYGGQWCASYASLLRMPGMRLMPDLISANTVINAAPWEMSWVAFSQLFKSSIQVDVVSHASIMPSDERSWEAASLCVSEMQHRQIAGNIRICNSALQSASKGALWSEVLNSIVELKGEALEPDGITYTLSLSAVEQTHLWRQALIMTSQLQSSKLPLDQVACSSIGRAHAVGNIWQECMTILRKHGSKIRLDVVMQNEVLDAYEKSADWQMTLQACSAMRIAGLKQDRITFCAVMSGCQTRDSWRWMTGMLQHLTNAEMYRDQTCFNSAISAYTRTLEWCSAIFMLSEMPQHSISADEISFNAAMQACSGQPHWERMFLIFMRMAGIVCQSFHGRAFTCHL